LIALRALGLVIAASLLASAPAQAAQIGGRVSHPSSPEAAAGLLVQAIGIDASEQTILRETRTDPDGRYDFDDLPAPAAYLVRARYGEIVFPGGSAVFRPGEPVSPQTIDFEIFDTSSDASRLRLKSLQWVIARSAGVWRVQQSAVVENPDSRVVVVEPDAAPALRVALAPGHGDVEGVFGRLPEGVVIRDGVAEIRGPVLPGAEGFSLQLAYDLETRETSLDTVIALPDAVEELAVYVQDFGIDVDAGGLHPARPTREQDVIYQSFLGFELPAGGRLPFRVSALPPATELPQLALALGAALLAGALLFFVARPLAIAGRGAGARAGDVAEESPAKAALESALADLEHDFETGKLSPDDRDRLREDLRREALAALFRERMPLEAAGASGSEPAAPARACDCGRVAGAADRFCAGCGKAL